MSQVNQSINQTVTVSCLNFLSSSAFVFGILLMLQRDTIRRLPQY